MITTIFGNLTGAASGKRKTHATAHICEDPPVKRGSKSFAVNAKVKDAAVTGRSRARPVHKQGVGKPRRMGILQQLGFAGKPGLKSSINKNSSAKEHLLPVACTDATPCGLPVRVHDMMVLNPIPMAVNQKAPSTFAGSTTIGQNPSASDHNNLMYGSNTHSPAEGNKPHTEDSKSKDEANNPEPLPKDESRSSEPAESADNDFKIFFAKVMESLEQRGFSFKGRS